MEIFELPKAKAFSRLWVEAWNRHDVESVLEHFHEDVLFTSPVAAQLVTGSVGVIRGKDALRVYWLKALRAIPNLRFEVEALHVGVGVLVIRYRNQKGVSVNEVLVFRDGKVCEGHGTYPAGMPNPAAVGKN